MAPVTVSPSESRAGQGESGRGRPDEAPREVSLDFGPDTSIYDLILYFAPIRGINFVISDVKELQNKKVTIISQQSRSRLVRRGRPSSLLLR